LTVRDDGGGAADRVVVLSPHLDDAVLSAWSVLARKRAVHVVNVCTGLPPNGLLAPWDRMTGASSSRARMLERLAEDRVALERAGCRDTALDFPEAQYRQGALDSGALRAALEGVLDGAAEAWAPAGIGGHEDHVQIRNAALALWRHGGPAPKLYAELPYAVRYGWPGWVTAQEDDPYLVIDEWWQSFLPDDVALVPETHALSEADARAKLHALAAYRSQFPGLNGGPIEMLGRPQIIGHEVSWAVEAEA
jgi:LmbE family N-acetylglucosaminyl deacetylase